MRHPMRGSTGKALFFLTITAVLAFSATVWAQPVRVGIVRDGPWERYNEAIGLLHQEVKQVTRSEFEVTFPAEYDIDGGWTREGVTAALDRLFDDPGVDIVITMGYVASHEAVKRAERPKPVIAPLVMDAVAQDFPTEGGSCGEENLCYVNTLKTIRRDVRAFASMVEFQHLAILSNELALRAIPELQDAVRVTARAEKLEVDILGVTGSTEQALAELPDGVDAVMITPLLRMSEEEFARLVRGLNARKLPSYSFMGQDEVEKGVLASTTPEGTMLHVARAIAVDVLGILRGEEAGTLGVVFARGEEPVINMDTARAIDYYPKLELLTEARLLNEEPTEVERTLTLEQAVEEALKVNLDLRAAGHVVSAGAERVREARSPLLPQVDLASGAMMIDDDRAEGALGSAPEKTWTVSGSATQVIYADDAWSAFTVEGHLQAAREEQYNSIRLDITEEAATAYLEYLRAKTIERVQKANLRLTRANLERARVRNAVGIAGPDEVYRWQTQIAQNRQDVLSAEARSISALQQVNRVLHQPLDQFFRAEETGLDTPLLQRTDALFGDLVSRSGWFRLFRAFMVEEAMANAPELRGLDDAIEAQKRQLTGSSRDFWLPDFVVQADAVHLLAEDGEGLRADSPADVDDTEWSVGVFATFPLFEGGRKFAANSRAAEELSQLTVERAAAAERVEQRIHDAVNRTRASYPSIGLALDGAEAARNNMELVTDAYERGVKSIIELVDAQNASLRADLRAADAAYGFLIDMMAVQRAAGDFGLFGDEKSREAWNTQLREYLQKTP